MTRLPLQTRAGSDPGGWAIRSDVHGDATWREVADVTLRVAAVLRARDLGPARRVLVVAGNRPSTVIAHAACTLGGASSVPVNSHLTAGEIEYIAAECGARVAFVDSVTEDVTRDALARTGRSVEVVRLPDDGVAGGELAAFIGATPPLALDPAQRVEPSLLFTSGTTGRPKAVQLRATVGAGDLAGFVEQIGGHRLAGLGTHLVVGPLYHNGPLTAVRLLLADVPLVIHHRFDAELVLAAIEKHRVESSIMVPTHFVRLLALPADVRERADVSSLRQVSHTGGSCPVAVKRAMIEWWGPVLSESYGGTESGTVCSINSSDWLAHPGSVGRTVAPFEALAVDDDGNELPRGAEGRLFFRDKTGRGIVYEGDPDKTAAAHIAPGVFTLGEIGTIDDDGYVYITDRASDMVVSGGVNIYPAEVEQVLLQHADVLDVACIGVPDAEMGERLIALVQLTGGAEADPAALQAHCRSVLAGYKCPKEVRFVEQIPRNPMGKADKRALRAAHSASGGAARG